MRLKELGGDWALVTGASAGIGRQFAVQLAAMGMNIVLVARRETLINSLSTELTERYNVRTLSLPVDLRRPDDRSKLADRLRNEQIRVRILVNNAAFGRWGGFETTTEQIYCEMVELNVTAMVSLCHQFLPDFSTFPSSAVINVSSPAAYNPIPYMAVYAATKAFVSSFSLALHQEWAERGIIVQTLVPGPTASEFDDIAGAYASAINWRGSPDEVVHTSLAHLEKNSPLALHAKGTFKQSFFMAFFPIKSVLKAVAKMFRPPSGA